VFDLNRLKLLLILASLFLVSVSAIARPLPKAGITLKKNVVSAGKSAEVNISVSDNNLPSGYFYTVNIDVLKKPSGAELISVPGIPVSKITPSSKGDYSFKVVVNLVKKTSCGGIESHELSSRIFKLTVR